MHLYKFIEIYSVSLLRKSKRIHRYPYRRAAKKEGKTRLLEVKHKRLCHSHTQLKKGKTKIRRLEQVFGIGFLYWLQYVSVLLLFLTLPYIWLFVNLPRILVYIDTFFTGIEKRNIFILIYNTFPICIVSNYTHPSFFFKSIF